MKFYAWMIRKQQTFITTLLAGIPFMFSFNGDFVFDDSEAILKNNDVTSDSWIDPFYRDFWGTDISSILSHKSYRPLTILSFKLNYILNGNTLSPKQFKILNIILHVLCCNLVLLTYLTILKSIKLKSYKNTLNDIAYLAVMLFSTHPIHVEAVSGIVGRADILAGIMFFSTFLIYNKAMKRSQLSYLYLGIAIILAGLAMLFKENGITVLGLCVLHELITNVSNIDNNKKTVPCVHFGKFKIVLHSIIRILCLSIATCIMLYLRWQIMGGVKPNFKITDNPAAFATNTFTKVATINYIYFMNILLLLWPNWLCYDWSMGCVPLIQTIKDYRIFFVFIPYIFVIITIVYILNTKNCLDLKRAIIMSCGLLVIPFLPAANIFYPVGFVIAERVLYIPSAGYCLLVAVGFHKILLRQKLLVSRKILFVLYIFLIMIYILRSVQRSFEWQTEYKLFTSGLLVCPLNAKVHYNVAKVADAKGNVSWAMNEYMEAIRLYPEYYQAMNNYANLLKKQRRFTEAEFYLRKAIYFKNDFPAAWMNLGIVLASTKKFAESEKAYHSALKFRKNYPDCYYNLGNLYLETNTTDKAIDSWFKAISMNPQHNSAWTNLLAVLDNTGNIEKALQMIPKAIEALPDSPSVMFAIANIFGKINEYKDAEEYFLKAIRLFGNNIKPIHYANLGVLYHRWKKYDLAEEMYRKALEIDMNFKSARTNLENLKKLKNKYNY